MYLSRLILNLRNRGVLRDLGQPHAMHQTVARACGSVNEYEGNARVLYRIDQMRSGAVHCLVQSPQMPDWSNVTGNGYLVEMEEPNPAVKPLAVDFQPGQVFTFRLRANPTKRLGKGAGADKGKRVGLYDIGEQLGWIQRKAEEHGFRVDGVMPSQAQIVTGVVPGMAGGDNEAQSHGGRWFAVQYDGRLQVVDPERFDAALARGIGSAKAFGFGLLSLGPGNV
ncbi:MAG: type I-E CRISPR-associated protein Cas6/Cse3/CasE [Litorilinea sp.]